MQEPQGSVICPTLFCLFCNDLPYTVSGYEGYLQMYADYTTIYVIGPTLLPSILFLENLQIGVVTIFSHHTRESPSS